MKLKPARGRTVRDPITKNRLAEDGEVKELDTFWRRRLACGDVVEAIALAAAEVAGTASGSSGVPAEAEESEKTSSHRARRAANVEE